MRIVEVFEISGRGVGVLVDQTSDQSITGTLNAHITHPDGTTVRANASREWLRRHGATPIEREAFLLIGLVRADVPEGSELHLERLNPT